MCHLVFLKTKTQIQRPTISFWSQNILELFRRPEKRLCSGGVFSMSTFPLILMFVITQPTSNFVKELCRKVVEMLLTDRKFLFAPPFVLISCFCSADAFGAETGFEFSPCLLCFKICFCSPLHRVCLPARVRG